MNDNYQLMIFNNLTEDLLSLNTDENEPIISASIMIKEITPQHQNRLYAKILEALNVSDIVNWWVTQYYIDQNDALFDMYQLYIDLAGYQFINVKNINKNKSINDLVSYMEYCEKYCKKCPGKYFLHLRTNSYRSKRIKIEKFIANFIETCSKGHVLYDFVLFHKLIEFFRCMSKSTVKSIKHTGVFSALKHQTGFIRVASNVVFEMIVLQEALQKSESAEEDNIIKQKLQVLKMYTDSINRMILFLQTNIFKENWDFYYLKLHYMRQDCILELYKWMEIFPERYIQPENFNFIIRSLDDPHRDIRITALEIANKIIRNYSQACYSMIRKLIRPLKGLLKTNNYKLSILAVDIFTTIQQHFNLPNNVKDIIFANIYSTYYPIAAACGNYLANLIKERNNNAEDDGLLRLLIIFLYKALKPGMAEKYPFVIEAVYNNFPVLLNIKIFMKVLINDTSMMNITYNNMWLNVLIESCHQTFTGECSLKRIKSRKGIVQPEIVKEIIQELMQSLNMLIYVFGYDKLYPLFTLIRQHFPKDITLDFSNSF